MERKLGFVIVVSTMIAIVKCFEFFEACPETRSLDVEMFACARIASHRLAPHHIAWRS